MKSSIGSIPSEELRCCKAATFTALMLRSARTADGTRLHHLRNG